MKIQNARIRKAIIEIDDHGILIGTLRFDLDGSTQGFGGWNLEGQPKWMRRVLETVGVKKWEELPGKNLRISGSFEKVAKIGHIIEDRWFDPVKEFKEKVGE
jgi:hypothetical protein